MTKDQLDAALASAGQTAGTSGQTFYVPDTYLRFVRAIVQKTASVVQGQPNIAVPQSFASPLDLTNLLTLLNSPSNGHKLFLPVSPMRMLSALLRRVARRMNGEAYQFNDSSNPST